MSIYFNSGLEHFKKELELLGKFKTGKCCLYTKKLEDVDLSVLRTMFKKQVEILSGERIHRDSK
ncbi:MAG: DUF1801 domain-containing protein [Flavobacteriales bacterium]|nr:DUF1801 domain-containing protein [Flavobacteriales bacterium]